MQNPILWIHGDCLAFDSPAFQQYPHAPALWVWDDALLESWGITLKRVVFLYECLLELPVTLRRGDVSVEIIKFAQEHVADGIVTVESPSPHFRETCQSLRQTMQVKVLPIEAFVNYHGSFDLKRFSRYWQTAQRYVYDD